MVFTNLLWPYNLAVPSFFRAASELAPGEIVVHRIPSEAPMMWARELTLTTRTVPVGEFFAVAVRIGRSSLVK